VHRGAGVAGVGRGGAGQLEWGGGGVHAVRSAAGAGPGIAVPTVGARPRFAAEAASPAQSAIGRDSRAGQGDRSPGHVQPTSLAVVATPAIATIANAPV